MMALALGIGSNTAIFSVVNGVLLRPLPYPEPGRLMMIYETNREFTRSSVAYPNFLDWQRESRSFTGMAAFRPHDFNSTGGGEPERLLGQYVSAGLFQILGVPRLLGRAFLPQEDRQGAGCAVMLGHDLWQRRFAGDARIIGRRLARRRQTTSTCCPLPGRRCDPAAPLPARAMRPSASPLLRRART